MARQSPVVNFRDRPQGALKVLSLNIGTLISDMKFSNRNSIDGRPDQSLAELLAPGNRIM